MVDFVVDPEDPERVLSPREDDLPLRGRRQALAAARARGGDAAGLAGGGPALPRRAGRRVSVSADGGDRSSASGGSRASRRALKAVDAEHLYVALEDGTILETRDGGRTWKTVYAP